MRSNYQNNFDNYFLNQNPSEKSIWQMSPGHFSDAQKLRCSNRTACDFHVARRGICHRGIYIRPADNALAARHWERALLWLRSQQLVPKMLWVPARNSGAILKHFNITPWTHSMGSGVLLNKSSINFEKLDSPILKEICTQIPHPSMIANILFVVLHFCTVVCNERQGFDYAETAFRWG